MLRKKNTEVLVEQIHANRQQPRKHFEKMQLEELRDSICQFGILQPLILRRRWILYDPRRREKVSSCSDGWAHESPGSGERSI